MATQDITVFDLGGEHDITVTGTDDEILDFTVYNGAIRYDLTGATSVTLYVQSAAGGTTLYTATCSITTATLGEFTVTIDNAHWAGATFYYVNLIDSSTIDTTLVFGNVNLLET